MTESSNHYYKASDGDAKTIVQGLIDQCRDIFEPTNMEVYRWSFHDRDDQVLLVFMRIANTALDATAVALPLKSAKQLITIIEWLEGQSETKEPT